MQSNFVQAHLRGSKVERYNQLYKDKSTNHNCSRWHFDFFLYLFFRENKAWHFMWIICIPRKIIKKIHLECHVLRADPDQLAASSPSHLIWICTVCKGRAYPDSAGPGLIKMWNMMGFPQVGFHCGCHTAMILVTHDWISVCSLWAWHKHVNICVRVDFILLQNIQ